MNFCNKISIIGVYESIQYCQAKYCDIMLHRFSSPAPSPQPSHTWQMSDLLQIKIQSAVIVVPAVNLFVVAYFLLHRLDEETSWNKKKEKRWFCLRLCLCLGWKHWQQFVFILSHITLQKCSYSVLKYIRRRAVDGVVVNISLQRIFG